MPQILTAAAVLRQHVTLKLESLDRAYLNVYQPKLQTGKSVAMFLRTHFGCISSNTMRQITQRFLGEIQKFAAAGNVPIVDFEPGQRKEALFAERLQAWTASEGVVFIGKSQEKARTFKTEGRTGRQGQTYPWVVETRSLVNQFYFYAVDDDFGPFFLKYSSYFPYGAKLCINGHEYLKRQLTKEGIAFEARGNMILSCAEPRRMQQIANGLSAAKIQKLLDKWQRKLPCPFDSSHRLDGYTYEASMSQVEFACTQVFDEPAQGRALFEQLIRENIDLGRPERIQVIFGRRVIKSTPGPFQSRLLRRGDVPSLHLTYKSCDLKQYFKECRAHRGELTVNNPRDLGVGRRLDNLSALRKLGFQAVRRVLDVQTASQDHALSERTFREVTGPCAVGTQRASALKFGDTVVFAALSALILLRLHVAGFRSGDLRRHLAAILGQEPSHWTQGRLTYQLRRLRLHGLIERVPGSHSYTVTQRGFRVALWLSRLQARVLRPSLGEILHPDKTSGSPDDSPLGKAIERFDKAVDKYLAEANFPAAA